MRPGTLSAACLLLAAWPASAQWRVAAFAGHASTAPADVTVTALARDTAVVLADVPFAGDSSRSPIYYGWRVSRAFGRVPWLAIEGEFIHAKTITHPGDVVHVRGRLDGAPVDAERPVGTVLPRFALSHGLNFLLANAVARVDVGGTSAAPARLALTARAGVGPTLPHVEATFAEAREDAYHTGRAGWQVAGGVEARVTAHLWAIAELKWTATRQAVGVGDATIAAAMRTRHAVAGLGWQF